MADITVASRIPGKRERFVDLGDDVIAPVVAIGNLGGDVVIEGDGVFDTTPVEAALDLVATEATLADVKTAVEALVTLAPATEAKQDDMIAAIGDLQVALLAKLDDVITALGT